MSLVTNKLACSSCSSVSAASSSISQPSTSPADKTTWFGRLVRKLEDFDPKTNWVADLLVRLLAIATMALTITAGVILGPGNPVLMFPLVIVGSVIAAIFMAASNHPGF